MNNLGDSAKTLLWIIWNFVQWKKLSLNLFNISVYAKNVCSENFLFSATNFKTTFFMRGKKFKTLFFTVWFQSNTSLSRKYKISYSSTIKGTLIVFTISHSCDDHKYEYAGGGKMSGILHYFYDLVIYLEERSIGI